MGGEGKSHFTEEMPDRYTPAKRSRSNQQQWTSLITCALDDICAIIQLTFIIGYRAEHAMTL